MLVGHPAQLVMPPRRARDERQQSASAFVGEAAPKPPKSTRPPLPLSPASSGPGRARVEPPVAGQGVRPVEDGSVNPRAEAMERRLEWPLLIAALLTIPAIAIEQSSVEEPWDTIATVLNWIIWLAFLTEAVLMLQVVDDRGRWLRDHPLDLAIVVLTPPFLPASLQAARVFRLLRLVRLLKLAVLSRRLLSTEGVRDAAVLALLMVLGGGAAFAAIENGHQDEPVSAWDGV
jgi:hypothetical protein